MHFNPTAITFIGYLVLMVMIGFYAWHHTRSFGDYILGGRKLGGLVTALSVGASDMSGWLLMGVPGAAYIAGVSESWIAIGLTIGAWLNWKLVAARLRLYTEVSHNALTLPDYFRQRFEDKSHWLAVSAAAVILVFFTIYCASGMVAGARLFENTFHLPYSTALWLGAIATIAYVFIGGFLAVSWTDTIQASLMCIALIVTPVAVMIDLGGASAATSQVAAINPDMLSMMNGQTTIGIISLLAWGLGYCGQPHILVRFMATRSIRVIPNARRISITWMIFCLAGSVAAGFFGASFGPVILISLWWKRMTRNGALAGMLVGAITVLVWHYFAWFDLYEILPGFILGSLAIIVVSLLDKAPEKEVTDAFNTVERRLVEES